MTETVFGEPDATRTWQLRPSAYALLLDRNGLLAVVQAPDGYFLPGGGIESGEDGEAAVLREIEEETGQDAHVLWQLAEADQYVPAAEAQGWLKRSQFFLAELFPRPGATGEFPVLWLSPEQAAARLTYPSHRWMVERFQPYLKA